jgi:mannose-6-phosphate isomerase-like protein (cupin superfamily)
MNDTKRNPGDAPEGGRRSVSPELIEIRKADQLLAIILRASYRQAGIHFLTPDDLSQQLAFMRHPPGKVILPHVHNPVERRVTLTQETLFIRNGRIRVDFYDDAREYLSSYELCTGDVILLIGGGHGFEVLEDTEFVEVKQGPYAGDQDKTRFAAVERQQLKVVR